MQSIKIPNRVFLSVADRMMEIRSPQSIDDFIFSILLNSKLRDWHRDNQVRLRTLTDRIAKLRKEYFVYETIENEKGEKIEQVKLTEAKTIPAIPAHYEKKIIKKAGWFSKEVSEQVLVEKAVPEKTIRPEPILLEGKTREEFNEKHKAILDEENEMVY